MKQLFSSPGISVWILFLAYFFLSSTRHLASLRQRSKCEMWLFCCCCYFLERKPVVLNLSLDIFRMILQLSWFTNELNEYFRDVPNEKKKIKAIHFVMQKKKKPWWKEQQKLSIKGIFNSELLQHYYRSDDNLAFILEV